MSQIRPVSRRSFIGTGCLALAALGLVPLSGCGAQKRKDAQQAVEAGLKQDLDSLKTLDSTTAAALFDSDFTQRLVSAGVDPAQVYGPLFSRMTYTIDGVDVTDDASSAVVYLTVQNVDVADAILAFQDGLTEYLLDQVAASVDAVSTAIQQGSELTEPSTEDQAASEQQMVAKMGELLASAFADPSLALIENSAEVRYVVGADQTWHAQDNSELARALLGGMDPNQLATDAEATPAAE